MSTRIDSDDYHMKYVSINDFTKALKLLAPLFIVSLVLISLCLSIYVIFNIEKDIAVSYYVDLVLIKEKKYPNGSLFQPRDIVSADVMAKIKDRYDIKDIDKLNSAIYVNYGFVGLELIQAKFLSRLNQKNLNTAEISLINKELEEQLESYSNRGLKITIIPSSGGVSAVVAKNIMQDMLKFWNDITIKKFNIMNNVNADIQLKPLTELDFNNTVDVLKSKDFIKNIKSNLLIINQDSRINSIMINNGKSGTDLLRGIETIYNNLYLPLLMITYQTNETARYIHNNEATIKFNQIMKQINSIDSVVNDIKSIDVQVAKDAAQNNNSTNDKATFQINEGAISSILKLADKASVVQFVKEMLEEKLKLTNQASILQSEIDITSVDNSNIKIASEFRQLCINSIKDYMVDYNEYMTKVQDKLYSFNEVLYSPVGSPFVESKNIKDFLPQILMVFSMFLIALILSVVIKVYKLKSASNQ